MSFSNQLLRDSYGQVGYFRETWDDVGLQFWPRTTSNTDSLKKYIQDHPAAAGGGAFVTITILIGIVFACGCFFRGTGQAKTALAKDLEMYGVHDFGEGYKDDPDYEEEYGEDVATSNDGNKIV